MFVPVLLIFWAIIIGMGWWQIQRVQQLKRNVVYEQLRFIGDRLAELYNTDQEAYAKEFVDYTNKYYNNALDYDPVSIQVRTPDGHLMLNLGNIENGDFQVAKKGDCSGVIRFDGTDIKNIDNDKNIRYLYYKTNTHAGEEIIVLLPYTHELAETLSETTKKFWLIFFAIGLGATLLAYVSTHYLNRSIKLLRSFAHSAANNPDFVGTSNIDFPHDELGDISRQILTIYNQRMTEMKHREREHIVALHAVEEKNRIKHELTGNINHELKTPVGVIQGYIDTIIDNPDMDDATRQRFLLKTHENVHRLSSLIADVTVITRLESGDKLVNMTEVDFHELAFSFSHFLDEGNVLQGKMGFYYEMPVDCRVQANESLLHSMLLNFVKNSVAYSQGTECHLDYIDEDEDFYRFCFYDNGVGVAPEHFPHLFDRFYRVNAGRSRDTGGTGLGLPIVSATIKSFGGDIEVTNHMPSGLEFIFTLPKYKGRR